MSEQQPPASTGPSTATPSPAPPAAPEQPVAPRPSRGRKTVADLVRSLLVVLVLVFVVVALNAHDDTAQELQPLDYSGEMAQARDTAPYDVLAPIGLPDTWIPTSARTDRVEGAVTWHLGLVTPKGDYAGVEQSDGDREALVASVSEDAQRAGTVTLNGVRWRRLEGGRPEKRTLVLDGAGVTTVVAGGASWTELETLARSLQASGS